MMHARNFIIPGCIFYVEVVYNYVTIYRKCGIVKPAILLLLSTIKNNLTNN